MAASVIALPNPSLRHWPALLAGLTLVLTALLPRGPSWICELAVIIALGVPHGALDGEIARDVLRPQLGRAWFLVFALPYLTLFSLVLAAWWTAPLCTLAVFLAASVWHFGSEDAPSEGVLEALARGGLPVALPVLLHPAATATVFATVADASFAWPPTWLEAGSLCWLALAALWVCRVLGRGDWRTLVVPGALVCLFVALPPLAAFAIYFVCVHAPAHTTSLIRNRLRARRVRGEWSALVLALPLTGMTLLIGGVLWSRYTGPAPERLLCLTIQILAALTLPHMLLDIWQTQRERTITSKRHKVANFAY